MNDLQQRVLKPTGALTMDTAAEHVANGRAMAAAGDLEVDLSGVSGFDSAALALVLDWMRESAAHGRKLTLTSIPPELRSLAELYGVDDLLSPHEVAGNV